MVLAFCHTLRTHKALSRPYALPGLLEVVHRLFEHGVFVGHTRSIRVGILRSPYCLHEPRGGLATCRSYSKGYYVESWSIRSCSRLIRSPLLFVMNKRGSPVLSSCLTIP